MSLLPKEQQQKSPASELMLLYSSCTNKPVRLSHFTKLLKTHKPDEIISVIEWLKTQPPAIRDIPSDFFVSQYKWLKEQSLSDLAGYSVTGHALKIAKAIDAPANYVQHALDTYTKLLVWLRGSDLPDAYAIWERMLPPTEFVTLWFTKIVPGISQRYRKFEVYHPKFQVYMLRLAVECSSAQAWVKLASAYDQ